MGLVVVAAAGYGFRQPLQEALVDRVTANMFVEQDADAFDPGIAVGQLFPTLNARLTNGANGRQVTDIGEFMGSRGVLVFVNRSVDW